MRLGVIIDMGNVGGAELPLRPNFSLTREFHAPAAKNIWEARQRRPTSL